MVEKGKRVPRTRVRQVAPMEYMRRVILGLSQTDMATVCEISQSAVSRYEIDSPDDISIAVIRRARAYAKANGIFWPATLTDRIIDGEELAIAEDADARKVGRPAKRF